MAVDDDPVVLTLVKALLEKAGCAVQTAETGRAAIRRFETGFRGTVVLDFNLPDLRGTEVFAHLHRIAPECPVIFLTGEGSMDLAIHTISEGAFEFLDKKYVVDRLVPVVEKAAQSFQDALRANADGSGADPLFPAIITRASSMLAVFRAIRNAIDSSVTVLIRGESGTGKELVAKAIHESGPRGGQPFVPINCAGIPESLLEAELFGYERGAFTGARNRKLGKFEVADKGTLFLDEIGEMHPALQAKLLRVLQEGEFQRVGGVETLRADVRVLSATHRNLEKEVEAGTFREDLYYRLAVFTIHLPPLRDREGDIDLLARYFLQRFARREGRQLDDIDPRAMEILESYSFPGNVRELENVISHAVVSSKGNVIAVGDLPKPFLQAVAHELRLGREAASAPETSETTPPGLAFEPDSALAESSEESFPSLQEMEKRHLVEALRLSGGNKAQAARALGISRMTLYRKLKDLGMDEG